MATRDDVAQVLTMLAAAYPHFKLTADTTRVYCQLLSDLPIEALKAAAISHARQGTFFPSVAELTQATYDILIDELALPSAPEAWGMVVKRMRSTTTIYRDGQYYTLEPMLPIIEKAVAALGGWKALGMSENATADRARFFETYRILADRERQRVTEHPAVTAAKERYKALHTLGTASQGSPPLTAGYKEVSDGR